MTPGIDSFNCLFDRIETPENRVSMNGCLDQVGMFMGHCFDVRSLMKWDRTLSMCAFFFFAPDYVYDWLL